MARFYIRVLRGLFIACDMWSDWQDECWTKEAAEESIRKRREQLRRQSVDSRNTISITKESKTWRKSQ